jgi:hypothetical protein
MFHSNEYQMKQRLHDLQEEYFSYKMERLFRPKKNFFWKKLLKRLTESNDKVVVREENSQPFL